MNLSTAANGAPAARPPSPDRDELGRRLLSRNLPVEHAFVPLRVEGRLPPDLRGTLLRNGPGLFELFGTRVAHSFEADGAITGIRLEEGRTLGACRVTASAGLEAERAAGRMLYGSSVAWPRRVRNNLRGKLKNTANTSVMTWQGRVLALMEAARPTELSVDDDIRTVGETDLGAIGQAFSAHPHRVAARGATYNFGVRFGPRPAIELYELPDAGPARRLGEVRLDFNPMLHDFIATQHHLVFFVSPVALRVGRMLLGLSDFSHMWEWQPRRGTEVIAVPIDAPAEAVRFTVDAFYQWHFANAWSRSPRQVVIDYVRYRDFQSFGSLESGRGIDEYLDGHLHRAAIDLDARRLQSDRLWDRPCEFPRIHPAREGTSPGATWLAADRLQSIARVGADGRADSFDFGPGQVVSEPVFVPRRGDIVDDADGWVTTLVYDGANDGSHLAILDGKRLADGPLARCWFDHFVPMTFHGTWVAA